MSDSCRFDHSTSLRGLMSESCSLIQPLCVPTGSYWRGTWNTSYRENMVNPSFFFLFSPLSVSLGVFWGGFLNNPSWGKILIPLFFFFFSPPPPPPPQLSFPFSSCVVGFRGPGRGGGGEGGLMKSESS